jgi:hypothetical protein
VQRFTAHDRVVLTHVRPLRVVDAGVRGISQVIVPLQANLDRHVAKGLLGEGAKVDGLPQFIDFEVYPAVEVVDESLGVVVEVITEVGDHVFPQELEPTQAVLPIRGEELRIISSD